MLRSVDPMLHGSKVVAAFLNDRPRDRRRRQQVVKEQQRVLDLLDVVRMLQARIAKLTLAGPPWSDHPQTDVRVRYLMNSANEILARYKHLPAVQISQSSRSTATPRLIASTRAEPIRKGADDTRLKSESNVVRLLLELLNENLLDRLFKCPCGRWFGALRRSGKFCSTQCRQKKYRNQPGYKESRRAPRWV
jgi:hypothetical protein